MEILTTRTWAKEAKDFESYYEAYLKQHPQRLCRRMDFAATSFLLAGIGTFFFTGDIWAIALAIALSFFTSHVGLVVSKKSLELELHQPHFAVMARVQLFWDILSAQIPL